MCCLLFCTKSLVVRSHADRRKERRQGGKEGRKRGGVGWDGMGWDAGLSSILFALFSNILVVVRVFSFFFSFCLFQEISPPTDS